MRWCIQCKADPGTAPACNAENSSHEQRYPSSVRLSLVLIILRRQKRAAIDVHPSVTCREWICAFWWLGWNARGVDRKRQRKGQCSARYVGERGGWGGHACMPFNRSRAVCALRAATIPPFSSLERGSFASVRQRWAWFMCTSHGLWALASRHQAGCFHVVGFRCHTQTLSRRTLDVDKEHRAAVKLHLCHPTHTATLFQRESAWKVPFLPLC